MKKKQGINRLGKPSKKMVEDVQGMNDGKIEIRINEKTTVLVDPEVLEEKGQRRIIDEFNGIYFKPAR